MKKLLCGAIAGVLAIQANSYAADKSCIYCRGIIRNARSDYERDCHDVECWVRAFTKVVDTDQGSSFYKDQFAYQMINIDGETWAEDLLAGDNDESICTGYCQCDCFVTWTSVSTGIERATKYTCDMGECVASGSQWRCKWGYYGNPTSDTSGCTKCPNSKEGGAGTGEIGSSNPGATSITQCFIESGNEVCDETGCFDYMQDCYYKN